MEGSETRIVNAASLEGVIDDRGELLVMIYGARIGHKVDLVAEIEELTVGRDVSADIQIDDDSVSRVHCKMVRTGRGWQVQDLGSTNGTFVSGQPIERAPLRDGDHIKVGSTIFKYLSAHNIEAAYHEEIYRMAIYDGLTQIHNRRYFEEFTEREISRALRHNRELSLLLFDIDRFKRINDTYGHLSGDHVLRHLAATLRRRIRREELFARYAGDEFVIVLPETAPIEALKFAEMLRALIAETIFEFEGQRIPVTISCGAGALVKGITLPSQLVAAADAGLYRAKHQGRNAVCA